MLLLDTLASAIIAILTGLGVGSGGLLVIYLTLVSGNGTRYPVLWHSLPKSV